MYDNLYGLPIGLQIRRLRQARNLTLERLADCAGTSAPTLHRYEGGWDRFEIRTLERIGTALDAGLEVRFHSRATETPDSPTAGELVGILAPLFWDRELRTSDLSRYPAWVLGRVLLYGQLAQVRAARRFFGDQAIASAVRRRDVDDRTRNYWAVVLADPCIPKS